MTGTNDERIDSNPGAGPRFAPHRLGRDRKRGQPPALDCARGGGARREGTLPGAAPASAGGGGDRGGLRQYERGLDAEAGPCAGGGHAGAGKGRFERGGIRPQPGQEGRGRGRTGGQEPGGLHDQAAVAGGGGCEGGCGGCAGGGDYACASSAAFEFECEPEGRGMIGMLLSSPSHGEVARSRRGAEGGVERAGRAAAGRTGQRRGARGQGGGRSRQRGGAQAGAAHRHRAEGQGPGRRAFRPERAGRPRRGRRRSAAAERDGRGGRGPAGAGHRRDQRAPGRGSGADPAGG
uniref:LigA n=1 Tax=Parastrongyloides trichosuri TaxID=131310 RepID=A0A0N4ZA79_PARTI